MRTETGASLRRSLLGALAALPFAAAAAGAAHAGADGEGKKGGRSRVVFDVSVGGEEYADALLRNVENLRAALGAESVEAEVVVYGEALPLLLRTGNASQASRMQKLAQGGGVRFVACENSMRRAGVTREALLPFAGTVDSGVAELVRRQAAGWAYLKPGG